MKLTFEEMYDVIGQKKNDYEGQFITAVKTTKIFCRPSCRAKKPLAKNVVFYQSAEEALKHGYRPCKICKPMELQSQAPKDIARLIAEILREPAIKITDTELRKRGLQPNTVRRWFKKHHNMTFQTYQRLIRLNTAYEVIRVQGVSVTQAAFGLGYDSLSGFHHQYLKIFGAAPKNQTGKQRIFLHRFATKIGPMFAAATEEGLCLLEFTDRRMLETEFEDLSRRLNGVFIPGTNCHIETAKQQVREYMAGQRKKFSIALLTPGTDFQQLVWEELQTIPYGETKSYKKQAENMGRPHAVRAVARANGMNRIAIVIPCHRVIGSDGSLTGYAGGMRRKQWLLDLER